MNLWKAWHHLPSALVKAQATLDMIILAKWISSYQANDEIAKNPDPWKFGQNTRANPSNP